MRRACHGFRPCFPVRGMVRLFQWQIVAGRSPVDRASRPLHCRQNGLGRAGLSRKADPVGPVSAPPRKPSPAGREHPLDFGPCGVPRKQARRKLQGFRPYGVSIADATVRREQRQAAAHTRAIAALKIAVVGAMLEHGRPRGGMAEWSIAAVLKTADRKVRGFESLSLRQSRNQ